MADYLNGHPIVLKDGNWYFKDTGKPTVNSNRLCGHCNKDKTIEGHDYCLGTLPEVMNACCGHGVEDEAYVMFWYGNTIHGREAIAWQKKHRQTKKL